jgi:hypothetical protein
MGGFASSVQAPQTSGQSGGKFGQGSLSNQQLAGLQQAKADINATVQPSSQIQAEQAFNTFKATQGQQSTSSSQEPINNIAQAPRPMGKGGVQTNSATSGQPRVGMQNQYSNTVGQWDNTQIQPVQRNGKGKGA